jgi:hypothetical protein
MTRPGRWAPGLHAAAVAVGLLATFLPVLTSRYTGGPGGQTQEQRNSFWETTVDPPPDPLDSFAFLVVHDPTLLAGGVVFVAVLLALGAAGLLAASARRRPELLGRSRTASAAAGAAVFATAATICAHVYARTVPIDYGDAEMVDFLEVTSGPAFYLLCATGLLAAAAVLTALARPEPEAGADLDTPPLGLPVSDPLDRP